MLYPPSMIAAGSVGAAAQGLLQGNTATPTELLNRLHDITGIDAVSVRIIFNMTNIVFKILLDF